MTTLIKQDLDEFNKFVQSYPNAEDDLSLEDYVCLWRAANERDETIAAIREGLDDLEAGRVRPADAVMADLRQYGRSRSRLGPSHGIFD